MKFIILILKLAKECMERWICSKHEVKNLIHGQSIYFCVRLFHVFISGKKQLLLTLGLQKYSIPVNQNLKSGKTFVHKSTLQKAAIKTLIWTENNSYGVRLFHNFKIPKNQLLLKNLCLGKYSINFGTLILLHAQPLK